MCGAGSIAIPKDRRENALVRMRLLRDAANDMSAAAEIRAMCAKDILFWVNVFGYTFDPRLKESVVPFVTYDYQDEAIVELQSAIDEGRDVVIGKSRDMGASWLNVLVPTYEMQFQRGRNFLLVSRNESYVDEKGNPKSLFWKIDFLLKHQPRWLRPRNVSRKDMHIENADLESVIDGESTTGEVGRGDRRTAILMDEFAAFETKAGYAALASTQSTTNCRIFNSTPKGVANAFYDVYHKTSAKVIRMHWSQHPVKCRGLYCSTRNEKTGRMELRLDDPWKGVVEVCEKGTKAVRKVAFPEDYPFVLDGKVRSPWYDRECSRAVNPVEIKQELDISFEGSDYQFFDPIAIESYKEHWCRDAEEVGDIEIDPGGCRVLRFTANGSGKFFLFERFCREGFVEAERRFVIGVDVSAGTGASNSTMAVYDRKTNEKVAEYANPNILPDAFGRFVVAVARLYNDALVIPDRSGPTGEVLVRRMIAEGYTHIYRRRNERKLGAPVTDEAGVYLNPAAKTTCLEQYRDAIGRCAVINRSSRAMDECLRFVRTANGNVEHSLGANSMDPGGARSNHGDLVIADALASMALLETEMRDEPQEQVAPEGSLKWRMERAAAAERGEDDSLGKGWEP